MRIELSNKHPTLRNKSLNYGNNENPKNLLTSDFWDYEVESRPDRKFDFAGPHHPHHQPLRPNWVLPPSMTVSSVNSLGLPVQSNLMPNPIINPQFFHIHPVPCWNLECLKQQVLAQNGLNGQQNGSLETQSPTGMNLLNFPSNLNGINGHNISPVVSNNSNSDFNQTPTLHPCVNFTNGNNLLARSNSIDDHFSVASNFSYLPPVHLLTQPNVGAPTGLLTETPSQTVRVSNLNFRYQNFEQNVAKDLFTLFGVYGDVNKVVINDHLKDTGLIEFMKAGRAEIAIQNLNGKLFYNRELSLSLAASGRVKLGSEGF